MVGHTGHLGSRSRAGRRRALRAPLVPLALTALLGGCLDVADGRADIDARVGQLEARGAAVAVDGGRAAVRGLGDHALHLWAGAPAIAFSLSPGPGGAGLWSVRIDNAMPGARLRLEGADDDAQPTLSEQSLPTRQRWQVRLQAQTSARLSFQTDDHGADAAFRYAVFADVQDAIDDVQDIYAAMNRVPGLRFVLMSGDLTEQGELPALRRFQRELESLAVPCFTTLGNHELGVSEGNYHSLFGRGSHHFTFHGAHFTFLDDASATLAPRVYGWLRAWLSEGRDAFHSVYTHLPPLDAEGTRGGAFASRAEANKLLGMFARAKVDLTVYGHVHSYYAYQNAGIPAFITGGGGAIPERFDRIGRHFLTVEVDPVSQRQRTALVHVD